MKFKLVFCSAILFLACSLDGETITQLCAQTIHGQRVRRILIAEHVEVVGAAKAKESKVFIGPCHFLRANSTRDDWKSYVEAYTPPRDSRPLYTPFVYEKFPKVLNFIGQLTTSKNHPKKIIDKERVGTAKFYFEPIPDPFDPFDFLRVPAPTDLFDMSFGKTGPSVMFFRDLTKWFAPSKVHDHTCYSLQLKIDGPNNVSRTDTLGDAYKYLAAIYVEKPDGTLERLASVEPYDNAVEYRLFFVKIPDKYAVAGKFTIIGKVLRKEHSFTDPDDPGHGWSDYTPFGRNNGFERELLQKNGVRKSAKTSDNDKSPGVNK